MSNREKNKAPKGYSVTYNSEGADFTEKFTHKPSIKASSGNDEVLFIRNNSKTKNLIIELAGSE